MNAHRCPKATRAAFLTLIVGTVALWAAVVWALA